MASDFYIVDHQGRIFQSCPGATREGLTNPALVVIFSILASLEHSDIAIYIQNHSSMNIFHDFQQKYTFSRKKLSFETFEFGGKCWQIPSHLRNANPG